MAGADSVFALPFSCSKAATTLWCGSGHRRRVWAPFRAAVEGTRGERVQAAEGAQEGHAWGTDTGGSFGREWCVLLRRWWEGS